jgi:hypothetical protein
MNAQILSVDHIRERAKADFERHARFEDCPFMEHHEAAAIWINEIARLSASGRNLGRKPQQPTQREAA